MSMQMTGPNGILSVPSEHLPGLVTLVALAPAVWFALWTCRTLAARRVAWAEAAVRRYDGLSFTAKAALGAAVAGALVHAAIIPTHWGDARVTAVLFIVDTVGFAVSALWTFTARRHWRLVGVAMLGGTACFYALYILTGWETADPVGLLTTTIELAGALILLSPSAAPVGARGRHEYGVAVAAVPVALLSLLGTVAVAGTAQAAGTPAAAAPTLSPTRSKPAPVTPVRAPSSTAMPGMSSSSTTGPDRTTALSLATTSPAGPIVWPDAMTTMAAGMEMATPDCDAQPTAAEQNAAVSLVDRTVAAAAPYASLAAAKAAGYVPVTRTGQKIVHYIDPAIYRQGDVLDPAAIPALVYVNTPHGAVLSAAMYLMPRTSSGTPPQPGGCLTQWHIHTDLCFRAGTVVGNDTTGACPAGTVNQTTQPMMHVWLTPVAGGPLAPDPSSVSEVESADAVPPPSPPNATA